MAKADVERIKRKRAELLAELRRLQDQISGLDIALDLIEGGGQSAPAAATTTQRRSARGAKEFILRKAEEVAPRGLMTTDLIALGAEAGVYLRRDTVSSLLSRLKAEGVLEYGDGKYYWKGPAHDGQKAAGDDPAVDPKPLKLIQRG